MLFGTPNKAQKYSTCNRDTPVIRKNEKSPDFSCCDVLQPVFMVKSAEYWNGNNAVIFRNVVPLDLKFNLPESEVRDCWPETRVRTSSVVMIRPLLQDLMNMGLVQWNDKVDAFPAYGPNQPLTE